MDARDDEATLPAGTVDGPGPDGPSDGLLIRHDAWLLWRALCGEAQANMRLQRQLDAIHGSRSWRVTAPLRAIQGWLRRVGGAASRRPLAPCPDGTVGPMSGGPGDGPDNEDRMAALTGSVRGHVFQTGVAQLLVDVTELALEDHGGGIQRVVARILSELVFAPPSGFTVVPVRLGAEGRYLEARRFLSPFIGMGNDAFGPDRPVTARSSDVFIGLDLIRDRTDVAAEAIQSLRLAGARIVVVIYDLLPVRQPQWFPGDIPDRFGEWFDRIAMSADGVACISVAVAEECKAAAKDRLGRLPPPVATFPMGADFAAWLPRQQILPRTSSVRVLMVGTLEPRKGHALALDAVEMLWTRGLEVELVIAGRVGWNVAALRARIATHAKLGSSLHWVEQPSDGVLAGLYRESDFLLMASSAEGFGLPIVEAGRAGCGLILRDLPVFREIAGNDAHYFSGGAERLAEAIRLCVAEGVPAHRRVLVTSDWSVSTDGLLKACGIMAPRGGPRQIPESSEANE